MQTGRCVVECLEPDRFERNRIRHFLEGERLNDARVGDLMKATPERVRRAVPRRDVTPLATVTCIPSPDRGAHAVRSDPASKQHRVGVRGHQLGRGRGKVACDANERNTRIGLDRCVRIGRCRSHDAPFFLLVWVVAERGAASSPPPHSDSPSSAINPKKRLAEGLSQMVG